MIPAPRSILIVNIRLIGDVILTTPLIGLLKGHSPKLPLTSWWPAVPANSWSGTHGYAGCCMPIPDRRLNDNGTHIRGRYSVSTTWPSP